MDVLTFRTSSYKSTVKRTLSAPQFRIVSHPPLLPVSLCTFFCSLRIIHPDVTPFPKSGEGPRPWSIWPCSEKAYRNLFQLQVKGATVQQQTICKLISGTCGSHWDYKTPLLLWCWLPCSDTNLSRKCLDLEVTVTVIQCLDSPSHSLLPCNTSERNMASL